MKIVLSKSNVFDYFRDTLDVESKIAINNAIAEKHGENGDNVSFAFIYEMQDFESVMKQEFANSESPFYSISALVSESKDEHSFQYYDKYFCFDNSYRKLLVSFGGDYEIESFIDEMFCNYADFADDIIDEMVKIGNFAREISCNSERASLYDFILNQISLNGYRDITINDDMEIICCSEERANTIADFLQAIGIDTVMTGQCGEEMWYITID